MSPAAPHVLIADDDPGALSGLARACRGAGYEVREARSAAEALAHLREAKPDAALVDLELEGAQALVERLLGDPSAPALIALSAAADVGVAVATMRAGAADFLEKPVGRPELLAALARALARRSVPAARTPREESSRPAGLVGRSPALRRVLDQIERVARTPRTTVLVTGESGVGKELVARAVHERSARRAGPFVALNCAALSESLLEAELFGYEPGAFTGGSPKGRDGLFRAAEGGTLLLDEIGELAPALQAKLLRVLQERCFRRVGGTREETVDVRIVASTNRDLEALVAERRFREDLFYRLNVMSIAVAPLRERRDDVVALAAHFLGVLAHELDKPVEGFSAQALEALERHAWPGNVRELRNTIERAVLSCPGGPVLPEHLGLAERAAPAREVRAALPAACSLKDAEHELIRRALAQSGGNKSRAAAALGIHRATLHTKLRALGLAV